MPITRPSTVVSTLIGFSIDMENMGGIARFSQVVDGRRLDDFSVSISGADLAAMMSASPDASKTRANDITDAVYDYCVAGGYIEGAIS